MSNILTIPLDDDVKNSKTGVPCGGCQWMGVDPDFDERGVCSTCDRTRSQIIIQHGKAEISEKEKAERVNAVAYHLTSGLGIEYA